MGNITITPGGDPRGYSETEQVRDEMAKLSHPARPDVDWGYVEQCCQSLFSKNGVDLRTAAFYTVARGHQAGIAGLSEGLGLVSALVSRYWAQMWPQQTHTRIELLSWLSGCVLQRLRALSLSYADLPAVYRAEKEVAQLCSTLQLLELKQLSRLEQIQHWLQQAITSLEHVDETSADALPAAQSVVSTTQDKPDITPGPEPVGESEPVLQPKRPEQSTKPAYSKQPIPVVPAPEAMQPTLTPEPPTSEKPPAPVQPKPVQKKAAVKTTVERPSDVTLVQPVDTVTSEQKPQRRKPGFIAGFVCALVLAAIAAGIAWWLARPMPSQALFNQVAPVITLNEASDVATLRSQVTPTALETIREPWLKALDEKLLRLAALPPLWKERQASVLLVQAQTLWPDAQDIVRISEREYQRREALAVPGDSLGDWYLAQQRLEALTQRLNALDERRGRWLTGSELKTAIFEIRQALDKTPPLEELLRQLAQQQAAGMNTAALHKQIDDRFGQLLNRYALLDEQTQVPRKLPVK